MTHPDTQTDKERAEELPRQLRGFASTESEELSRETFTSAADLIESLSTRLAALEEELREAKVATADAVSDSLRLHEDKMKFFERTIELESALAAERAKVTQKLVEFNVDEQVSGYEFRGDEGDYLPTEKERILLTDFAHGLLSDLHDAIRALSPRKEQG